MVLRLIWEWLVEHWKLLGVPTVAVSLVDTLKWFYVLRKARADALLAELALKDGRHNSPLGHSPLDDKILEFLANGVASGNHPFTWGGDVIFKTDEIADALSVRRGTLVDRLKYLEMEGSVRRRSGTLVDSAACWRIVRM
jgi:hypothetical protein